LGILILMYPRLSLSFQGSSTPVVIVFMEVAPLLEGCVG